MIRCVAVLALLGCLGPTVAAAQAICLPPLSMQQLADKYGEVRIGGGIAGKALVEVWVNPETGTWTLTVTTPGGPACMASGGTAWQGATPNPKPGTLN